MDFESPDVAKDFPGLYASESMKRSQSRDSDYSDEEKTSRKDLLGKKKEKRESKKDKGYVPFEGESSEDELDEARSPGKGKKNKSGFQFLAKDKKEKHNKSKDRDTKEKKEEKEKVCKKESKEGKKESKDADKIKVKKKKESKLLKIKDKKKKNIGQEEKVTEEKPIFGIPLQVAVERSKSHDDVELPVIVRECIDYIEEHGLACEGIYKISGLKSKVRNLKSQYNRGEKVYLYEHEPHIAASLLKQFLRDLPEPILTANLSTKFEEAAAFKNEQKKIEMLQMLMNELPNCNRLLLSWIFVHMRHVIALERRNKMNIQNVSIVLSPTMQISHNILQAFFTYSHILFQGIELKKYVPPIELDSSRLSLELPDSPSAIAEELSRQENVLNVLHAELNTGLRDQKKEEQLWEIQRVVTQLKRKLRFLRQVQSASNADTEEVQTKDRTLNEDSEEISYNIIIEQISPSNIHTLKNVLSDETADGKKICSPSESDFSENFESKDLTSTDVVKDKDCTSPESTMQDVQQESLKESDRNNTEAEAVSNNICSQGISEVVSVTKAELTHENNVSIPNLPPSKDDTVVFEDDDMHQLVADENMLRIQHDELALLGDELRRKINSEKLEIERLKMDINEYQQLYKYKRYSFDSTENSSSESGDSSGSDCDDEEDDLSALLDDLMKKNKQLELKNTDISKVIQHEREICLHIKVQMKMLQTDSKHIR